MLYVHDMKLLEEPIGRRTLDHTDHMLFALLSLTIEKNYVALQRISVYILNLNGCGSFLFLVFVCLFLF